MKYCVHCGGEIYEEAIVCVKCGRAVQKEIAPIATAKEPEDTMSIVTKVFLIIGCIAQGWLILPLAWCLPITISVFNCMKEKRPVSTGLSVCALLFVNLVAGICLLCMENNQT